MDSYKNMKQKLITTREVSHELGLSEKEVIQLAQNNNIPHFRIGEEFLRFKKEDIIKIKPKIKKIYNLSENNRSFKNRAKEFLYFNDFYIGSTIIIAVLVWLIVKDFF
ncbi:MAG: helix-turn-helix domain-containing protein [Candidatus Omnitrophica bacterium]|nr:helix-turn-helix domain-containing protein [Candidatus Omnitrophota bacterium]MCF7894810.1 helix-turn-helix domain-containing protein [Candidatus Omnitrophota bacterium]